jgi:hypothetical protein
VRSYEVPYSLPLFLYLFSGWYHTIVMIGPYLDFFFLVVNDNPVIDANMNILQMSMFFLVS